jgi:hypothetical protein
MKLLDVIQAEINKNKLTTQGVDEQITGEIKGLDVYHHEWVKVKPEFDSPGEPFGMMCLMFLGNNETGTMAVHSMKMKSLWLETPDNLAMFRILDLD